MKAKACLFTLLVFMLGLPCFSRPHVFAQEQRPSLIDTVEWLKGKSGDVSKISSGVTREAFKYAEYMSKAEAWNLSTYNGCALVWRSKKKTVDQYRRSYDIEMTVTMSFADLNPDKIEIKSAGGIIARDQFHSIRLFTTNGKKSIRWQFFIKETTTDNNSLKATITGRPSKKTKESTEILDANNLEITVSGQMGPRFTKAIQNAMSLCGGRTDKKEPF